MPQNDIAWLCYSKFESTNVHGCASKLMIQPPFFMLKNPVFDYFSERSASSAPLLRLPGIWFCPPRLPTTVLQNESHRATSCAPRGPDVTLLWSDSGGPQRICLLLLKLFDHNISLYIYMYISLFIIYIIPYYIIYNTIYIYIYIIDICM